MPDDPTGPADAPDAAAAPDALDARIAALRAAVDALPQRRVELARAREELAAARRVQDAAGAVARRAVAATAAVTLPRPAALLNLLTGRYAAVRDTAREAAVEAGRTLEAADADVQRLAAAESRRAAALDAAAAAIPPLAELEEARALSRLVAADDPRAAAVRVLDDELHDVTGQLREVDEADAAVAGALAAVDVTLDRLASAHAWGTYDTFFGGGLVASAVKHSRIDEADAAAGQVRRSLERVRTELADVRSAAALPALEIDGVTRTLDVWFDNIFSDWSVQSRIKDQDADVRHVGNRLVEVRRTLASTRADLERRRSDLLARRRRLLGA